MALSREQLANEISNAQSRVSYLRQAGLSAREISTRVAAETNICVYGVKNNVLAIHGEPGKEEVVRFR